METTTKAPFNKSVYDPVIFKTYKVIKKMIKYSFYITLFYFAYEGFMAWG